MQQPLKRPHHDSALDALQQVRDNTSNMVPTDRIERKVEALYIRVMELQLTLSKLFGMQED